jgi:hypothetical protein
MIYAFYYGVLIGALVCAALFCVVAGFIASIKRKDK